MKQQNQTLKIQRDFLLPMLTNGQVSISVNASLTLMYWHVGFKINEDILKNSRAEYGNEIVNLLSTQLTWTHLKILIYIDDDLKRTLII